MKHFWVDSVAYSLQTKALQSDLEVFKSRNTNKYSLRAALVIHISERSLLSTYNCLLPVVAECWEAAGCLLHFPGVVRQVLTYTAAPQRAGSLSHGSEQVGGGRGSASGGTWQGLSTWHFIIFFLLHRFSFLSHFNFQTKGSLPGGNANFALKYLFG